MKMLAKLKLIWALTWEQNASLRRVSALLLFEIISLWSTVLPDAWTVSTPF